MRDHPAPAESTDLDPPLRLGDLTALVRGGTLPSRHYFAACRAVRDQGFWHHWSGHALLAFAVAHLLAGVVFFFAYNWADLTTVMKFGLLQGSMVMAAAAWLWFGYESLPGQGAGVAVTMLLGVLMAVFGQIYQTGADAYELFLQWALLALPFALAARSTAHWLFWLVLANVAGLTFLAQAPEVRDLKAHESALVFALANLVVLAFVEAIHRIVPLAAWFRYPLLGAILVISLAAGGAGLFNSRVDLGHVSLRWLAIALPILIAMTGYIRARYFAPDFPILALATFTVLILIFMIVAKVNFEVLGYVRFAPYGILGLTAPCLVSVAALHIRRLRQVTGATT